MAVDVGAFNFAKIIEFMQSAGFYTYLLPFLLVFAILFAILEKTKVLGDGKTNINVLVALLIGLLLTVQTGIVQIINAFLPQVSLIFVVILMILIGLAMMSNKAHGLRGPVFAVAVVVAFIALGSALISSIPGLSFLSSEDTSSILTWVIPLIILGGTIYFLTRSGDEGDEAGREDRLRARRQGFWDALSGGFRGAD